MKPIYEPKGKAKEYGETALNIYTGCPHRCFYCFAPSVLRRNREQFHSCVEPRSGVVDATRKQIEREQITDKLIHLCFTCDPYPTACDDSATREIIKLLKDSGNHVQILTKGSGLRDFDLLDENDWYGVTFDGTGGKWCQPVEYRIADLMEAHKRGIRTWVSFEPIVNVGGVMATLRRIAPFVDKVKFGKLNYYQTADDWAKIGRAIEKESQKLGVDYYIKESLREEMSKGTNARPIDKYHGLDAEPDYRCYIGGKDSDNEL